MAWPTWTAARVRQISFIIFAGAVIAGSYLILERHSSTVPVTLPLHRSNAIRNRRRGPRQQPQPMDGDEDQRHHDSMEADDALTDRANDDASPAEVAEGQRLAELVYEIAKEKSKQEGIAHRGTYCDGCNITPIRGVRYHCSNCPDFDLCESCEHKVEHIRTHVFYKIKVPAPWAHKIAQKPWYPGKPELMPWTLPTNTANRLKEKVLPLLSRSQQENVENVLKGYYEQFSCIANTLIQEDSAGIGMAINYDAFTRCVVDHAVAKEFPAPNLIHDRLFHFFDVDSSNLIDFEEFVVGILLRQSSSSDFKLQRIFKAFDLDADGFVSRKDFLLMFRAYYELHRSLLVAGLVNHHRGENSLDVEQGPTLQDFAYGGRPLASYFASTPDHRVVRDPDAAHQGKRLDIHGDYVPDHDQEGTVLKSGTRDIPLPRREVIPRYQRPLRQLLLEELGRIMTRQPLNYLPRTAHNIAHDLPIESRLGMQHDWASYNGCVYIKPRFSEEGFPIPSNDLYLLVRFTELRDADWRSKVDDEAYFMALNKVVITRLFTHITEHIALSEKPHLLTIRTTQPNHFDDNPDEPEDKDIPHQHHSAAAHTIYTITQQALNSLLDPLFSDLEIDPEDEKNALAPYAVELERLHQRITGVTEKGRALLDHLYASRPHENTAQLAQDFATQMIHLITPDVTPGSVDVSPPVTGAWITAMQSAWQHGRKDQLVELTSMRDWRFVWINLSADSDLAPWRKMEIMGEREMQVMTVYEMEAYLRRHDILQRFPNGRQAGTMSFDEFRAWVAREEDVEVDGMGGGRLVKWVGSWLGLVVV